LLGCPRKNTDDVSLNKNYLRLKERLYGLKTAWHFSGRLYVFKI
jgi:hypothetical protein